MNTGQKHNIHIESIQGDFIYGTSVFKNVYTSEE